MADTQFLNANALTEKAWPRTFFRYMLENMVLSKFIGDSTEAVIQTDKNLMKRAGDSLTFRLRIPLGNAGGYDDSDLEGNEEAMNFYNFPVTIHERGNAVKSAGKMTEKRTKVNIRREATEALGDWMAEQMDNDLVYALSGLGNMNTYVGEGTSDIATVNEHAPSTNRILYLGQTSAGSVSTGTSDATIGQDDATDYADFLFGTKIISIAKRKAQLAQPKIRPIRIPGMSRKKYVMLIHPWQCKALRNETGAHGWQEIQQRANVRGLQNPLFQRMMNDAVGVYDDVILFEYDRIQTRVAGEVFDSGDTVSSNIPSGAGIARALLLGGQAGVLAWGQMPQRYEKNFDFHRKPGTAIDAIYGVSKTVFRDPGASQNTNTAQDDYAVLCVDTCYADDTL